MSWSEPPPERPEEQGQGDQPPRPTRGGLPGDDEPAAGGLPRWEEPSGGQSWQPQGWQPQGWQSQWQQESQWQQQQPPAWPSAAQQTTSGKATAALVLGICGFVVCPLICSVLALVFGYQGKREIDASGGRIGGRGMAVAGIVLGWIGVVLCALFILLIVVLAATGDLEDDSTDLQFDSSAVRRTAIVAGSALRLAAGVA